LVYIFTIIRRRSARTAAGIMVWDEEKDDKNSESIYVAVMDG
jgi:hypothetical protein